MKLADVVEEVVVVVEVVAVVLAVAMVDRASILVVMNDGDDLNPHTS
jgi:hypothetical protein